MCIRNMGAKVVVGVMRARTHAHAYIYTRTCKYCAHIEYATQPCKHCFANTGIPGALAYRVCAQMGRSRNGGIAAVA